MRHPVFLIVFFAMVCSLSASPPASLSASKLWLDVSSDLEADCKPAIEDFKKYFARITGHPLPTVPGGEATIPLRLQLIPEDEADKTFAGKARVGDYEIMAARDEVVLSGKTPLALTNALYGLLDSWGCRWVFPGELGEVIPENAEASIPLGKQQMRIASDPRILSGAPSNYGEGDIRDWVRRNRFGKQSTVTAHHSWASLVIPASIYNNPDKPDTFHPEYFALIGGKRQIGTDATKLQICTSNPEVIRLAIEHAKDYFHKYPSVDTFPCSPEDNFDFCQCENCVKLDPAGLTPEGLPLLTDRVVAFANEVARGIRGEFPDKTVGIYAYNNFTLPPQNVKPEENVMVHITRMNYDLLRLLPRQENDSSSHFVRLVEAWRKLTPNIYLYEYNPLYWAGGLFFPNYLEFAEAEKFFRDKGVLGFRSDPGELPFRNKINFMNDYLAMRVAVDSKIEPKQELAEICDSLFGPAGKAMIRYYKIMAKVTDKNPVPEGFLGGGIRYFHRMFTPGMMKEGAEALAQAKNDVGQDPTLKKRLRMVDLGHRYLENYLEAVWAAKDGDYEKSQAGLARLQRTYDTLVANKILDGASARLNSLPGGILMAQAEYTPAKAGFVQDWKVLGPFDNSQRAAEVLFAPFEPITDIEQKVKTPDGRLLKWENYHSPSGFLDLRVALGEVPSDFTALTAYAATTLQVDTPTSVQLSFNSFNSFRIYLNGKEIYFRPGQQLDLPGQHTLPVTLPAGKNTLVFRCTEISSSVNTPWGLYLRILDPENSGQPKRLGSAR